MTRLLSRGRGRVLELAALRKQLFRGCSIGLQVPPIALTDARCLHR